MKNVWKHRLAFVAATVVFGLVLSLSAPAHAAAKKAPAKHFMWVLKSKTATVYMLGSIHLAKKDLYPLDDVIESAFKKSDTLVLEVPLDQKSSNEAGTKLLAISRYGEGESLDKALGKAVKQKLDAHLAKTNVPKGAYNQFKPWLVSLLLTMQVLQQNGYDAQYGIDQHFYDQAVGKKTIVGLETTDDQVNAFKLLTAKSQEKMLEQTLDEIDKLNETISDTFKAWKVGDADKLDELMLKPMRVPDQKQLLKLLFVDRNIKMAKKIEAFLSTDKTYFVVVGSGHFVGKEGIIHLLRQKKLKVDQL